MPADDTVMVHFDSRSATAYLHQGGQLKLLATQQCDFQAHNFVSTMAQAISETWARLQANIALDTNTDVRLYATGEFQDLPVASRTELVNSFFVDTGLYLNVIAPDLEEFYTTVAGGDAGRDPIMSGIVRQEYRKVTVCGSFQQSLEYIREVISRLRGTGAIILSPPSTTIKPETVGSNFILFDYQDYLKNDRDTWRHKYIHMDTFREADAVVVCNPGGRVGQGTVFELGFMTANSKRVIFTEQPTGLSIPFPCEVGLAV